MDQDDGLAGAVVLVVDLDVGVVFLADGDCGHGASFRWRGWRRLRGEAPAHLICRVVLASASRSVGRVAPVVITGRCSGLRSGAWPVVARNDLLGVHLHHAERTFSRSAPGRGPAVEAGLAEFGARVRFRHPLVRSAAYRSASVQTRQELHGALAEATELIQATMDGVTSRGEGRGVTSGYTAALLYNGLSHYDKALAAAGPVCEYDDIGVLGWSLTELVEAAVRSGQPARASDALQRLTETTRASGTDWAVGTEARSRALLSEGETAEICYREAIERLGRTRMRPAVARAHLLYGEWLRRENRRRDARAELRTAHGLFTTMGIEAFAERARRELLATGDTVRKRTAETASELTAQEAHIARLAMDGRTNVEIGAQLSAPGPSNGISARCTPSSGSAHAESCGGPWPAPGRQSRRPSDRRTQTDAHHTRISCHTTGRVLCAGRRLRAVGSGDRQCAALGRLPLRPVGQPAHEPDDGDGDGGADHRAGE